MEYGIAHTFIIANNSITKIPIGYVVGIENIITYNNNNQDSKIEQTQQILPQGLIEIKN